MDNVRVNWLTGEKVLKPVEYRIASTTEGRWWWRKTVYWIESEFARLGPISTQEEANSLLTIARRS